MDSRSDSRAWEGDRQYLQECIELAHKLETHERAKAEFRQWCDRLAQDNPQAAALLTLLWDEAIRANRSALFWEELSNVEKQLCDRMTEETIQLQQNYLRLVQEQ
ncbi:hypothetical protein PN466_25115 [Roseofilum reptotaenium CS-1145]|uniref:Uncharacterized protein n=1 Tax=Roseofilum reptotaenium AO1-A TaxID=1925591 RepID=A0A1L9QVM7_9CYAN|nr:MULTISPECIES: hypothetical protein [Roseofilum]MBP0027358.1 hypothetical protein [Roseofilum sp. Guam]MDB9520230.1 hypothetical protein [Roseofilum reptotaenium CS-1145]OJJ26728.1 hypothetical protein BI308_04965 [Roseofilum reptotaenium AO1-A]